MEMRQKHVNLLWGSMQTLSTFIVLGDEMACGKEEYVEVENPRDSKTIDKICKDVINGNLFGFFQVDIHVPDELYGKV